MEMAGKIAILELAKCSDGCDGCALWHGKKELEECKYFDKRNELYCGTEYGFAWRVSGVYNAAPAGSP